MSSASTGGTEGSSPASSPASAASLAMAAPKTGTLVPNRIFVGGISASTTEAELTQLFSSYGNVKATKIISDRGGASKGYGFVTFETEEEAKRVQRGLEEIRLNDRKLNIAPAIKKQPFNRSFDGGTGSPPTVPTSTYYYANGMGLAYQNGMTFYNTGAPAPGTAIAPSDPTALYQAGVFGPQATTGHQSFAPMMYPCQAPSLYMPQQYQYPPMPYEPYYAGTMYTANGSPNATSGNGNGSGNGSNSAGATSPSAGPQSLPLHPPGTYYAQAAPSHHPHHPPVPGGPHPQQPVDHLYYSFATGPPAPPQHAQMGIATDQQMLLYAADASCQQPSSSDGQGNQQEDTHSTSSITEQPSGDGQTSSSSSAHHPSSGAPLVPMPYIPLKFSIPSRYTNFHPLAIHTTNMHNSQNCSTGTEPTASADDCSANQLHCKTVLYHHPAAMYIPHPPPFHATGGASLLPTPPGIPGQAAAYELSPKMGFNPREYAKSLMANAPYVKTSPNTGFVASGAPMSHPSSHVHSSVTTHRYGGSPANKYPGIASQSFGRGSSSGQYNKRNSNVNSHAYYSGHKSNHYGGGNAGGYKSGGYYTMGANYGPPAGFNRTGGYDYAERSGRPMGVHQNSGNRRQGPPPKSNPVESEANAIENASDDATTRTTDAKNSTGETMTADKPTSPPPAPYSPMACPLPSLSPTTPQVQFITTAATRYSTVTSQQQQQQQQQQQSIQSRRYPPSISSSLSVGGRGKSDKYSNTGCQNPGLRQAKYKMNGIIQANGKAVSEDSLGGAGDAPPSVGRMPITPPGTPRTPEQNLSDATCHQLQALSL